MSLFQVQNVGVNFSKFEVEQSVHFAACQTVENIFDSKFSIK
jgi:hypothetical protein